MVERVWSARADSVEKGSAYAAYFRRVVLPELTGIPGYIAARLLRRDLCKVHPELRDARIDYAWSGLMSYARHQMPQIGRLADGTWHALGFGGHGVGPTTAAGELIAEALAGGRPLPAGFADYGLPRVWGHAGRLAAQATYNWFELKDWVRQ